MNRRMLIAVSVLVVIAGAGWFWGNYAGPGGDMTRAGQIFLESLSQQQRSQATMKYDDPARLDWHFIPKDQRKGLQIKDMNEQQRKLAHELLASGLSEAGYDKATTIMSLEAILRELEKARRSGPIRDPERYYFTIFGTPTTDGRWGLSVEGHHLSLNFVIDQGQVVSSTPSFFGANPAEVKATYSVGPKKGTRVLRKEEDLAFQLLSSLDDAQRKQALIADKAPSDIRGPAGAQPPTAAPEGLPAGKFTESQTATLWALLEAYAVNMPKEVGQARLAKVKQAGIEKVHFAWAGAQKPGVGHYYRVQGPTFLIEFVNVQPDSDGNPANHIHLVWRDMTGDFGQPIEK
jgi:hypothetical protein